MGENYWIVLAGSVLALVGVRALPMVLAARIRFPRALVLWLEFLPLTLLGSFIALQLRAILKTSGEIVVDPSQITFAFLVATFSTLLAIRLTDRLIIGVSVGVIVYQLAVML